MVLGFPVEPVEPVEPVGPVKKGKMSDLIFFGQTGQRANGLNPNHFRAHKTTAQSASEFRRPFPFLRRSVHKNFHHRFP